MNKLQTLANAIYGEFLKLNYFLGIRHIPYGINRNEKRSEKVIVSLTSYGQRISRVLPYTIISILHQTYKPDMILLWLDRNYWNDNNLPFQLSKLRDKGLTIKYCEDLGSYTKLIPALKSYPDDIIITVDDDIYYRKDIVERLITAYKSDPSCIYSLRGCEITFDEKGNICPYNMWNDKAYNLSNNNVFPLGYSAVLYKKAFLHPDVFNKDLFTSLSPKADDVWFFFMEILQETKRVILPYLGNSYIPIDLFYQKIHKKSTLTNSNINKNMNDEQIQAIMKYYNIIFNQTARNN